MVELGEINSRMKDFYDLYWIAGRFELEGVLMVDSVRATFERRGRALPDGLPVALTERFATNPVKRKQWRAFLDRNRLDGPEEFAELLPRLSLFLLPLLQAASAGSELPRTWPPGGPWDQ